MAGISESSGERDVNVEPNLVPFIDLMSVCIIFLLVTAVWTQVSMIELGANVYGKKVGDTAPPSKIKPVSINVQVTTTGYVLTEGGKRYQIVKKEDEYDTRTLFLQLQTVKQRNPSVEAVSIGLADQLTYNEMIEGMDVILNAGFSEVSVATN